MAAARRALTSVREEPDLASNTCPTVHAMLEQAKAQQAAADAAADQVALGRKFLELIAPESSTGESFWGALSTIHGIGERLDKLCKWIRSKSLLWLVIVLLIFQTISRAPEEAPKLIESLANLLGALV